MREKKLNMKIESNGKMCYCLMGHSITEKYEKGVCKVGVKFAREYKDIHEELTLAVENIEGVYTFFEMDTAQWKEMDREEQTACIRTLADDLFYALGETARISVGEGALEYDAERHILKVYADPKIFIVNLI